jgi:hypothetical protein
MKEVIVIKRRRKWEWQVRDRHGQLLMSGRERTRPAARYQGYRALFMILAVGRRPVGPLAPAVRRELHGRGKAAPDLAHLQRPVRPLTPD